MRVSHEAMTNALPLYLTISGYDELLLVVRHYATSRANESLARTL